jgi:hypothetical protein
MSTICMKIDPGMHIGLHLVFFGKTGVIAVHTQDPKTKVSPRLKATVGLMKTEVVEFAMRSPTRPPTWRASCRCFRSATYQGEYPR